MGTVIIAYQVEGRSPQSVVTVNDPETLLVVAYVAMKEAEDKAARLAAEDPVLGRIQAAEVMRLREALEILVPGFGPSRASDVM